MPKTAFDRGLLALAGGLLFLTAALTACGSAATLRVGQARPELDAVQISQQLVADQAVLLRHCGQVEPSVLELVHRGARLEAARQRIGAAADAISLARSRPLDHCPPPAGDGGTR